MSRTRAIQIPGEVSHDEVLDDANDEGALTKVLDADVDDVASLKAKLAKAEAELSAAKEALAAPKPRAPKNASKLPDAQDVDVTKITGPVLTNQGYIVPISMTPGRGL